MGLVELIKDLHCNDNGLQDYFPETTMTIPSSKEIKALRLQHGLTQAACAKALDLTDRQWRRYEAGESIMCGVYWIYFNKRELWPQ